MKSRRLAQLLILCFISLCGAVASADPLPRVVYGFDREFPPFSFENPGGEATGFEVELMRAALKDRATLVPRPLSWYSVPLELSSGAINVTSGMIRTDQRAKQYAFASRPSFPLYMRFFTKVYKRTPSAALLRGQAVAVEEGSYQQLLLERFGGVNIKTYKGKAEGLRALYHDEVAAYCGAQENTYYYITKLNYGAITTVGEPLGLVSMYFAVNKDRGDILRLVNAGLDEVAKSGEYDRIYRKWFVRDLTREEISGLLKAAGEAATSAYAPYSKRGTGAAVLTATGKTYTACNVENAEFALSVSAIRGAVIRAVSEGELELRAVASVDGKGAIIAPDAEDLQFLYEFGRGMQAVLEQEKGRYSTPMLADLLPNPVLPAVTQLDAD